MNTYLSVNDIFCLLLDSVLSLAVFHTSINLLIYICIYTTVNTQKSSYLCPQFNHVWLHLIVGLVQIFDFFIQLFDLLFMLQPYRGGTDGLLHGLSYKLD